MLTYNFTDVVHMAAQAGVRYSLEDPQAYVSANYECFISLLDTLVEFPVGYLPYGLALIVTLLHNGCTPRPLWCMPPPPVCMGREHLSLSLLKSHSELQETSMPLLK